MSQVGFCSPSSYISPEEIDLAADVGAKVLRVPCEADGYDRDRVAEMHSRCLQRGITFLPILTTQPGSDLAPIDQPRLDAFGSYCATFARNHDVIAAEIWNEPNLRFFAPGGEVNPRKFGYILGHAAASVRAQRPTCSIILGGLAKGTAEGNMPLETFLRELKRHHPDIRRDFDLIGVHPYDKTPALVKDRVERWRNIAGDLFRSRPLALTEVGWATGGDPNYHRVDEPTQARYLKRTAQHALAPWTIFYALRDIPRGDPAHWSSWCGILTGDLKPKPSYKALQEILR